MLTKIFINNEAYEVDLLEDHEVLKQIKEDFIGTESIKELIKTNQLDKVILQYIDYYEKVEYKEKSYFILKSRVPVEFKQKTYNKKNISIEDMGFRVIGAIFTPITFFVTNIFDTMCNIKNMINCSVGSTKINAKYSDSESIILSLFVVLLNILFYIMFAKSTAPFWVIFIVQAVNILLGVLKPIKYHYNEIENYKLSAYTFDSKYENITADPIERLRSMKTTQDKKKIEFDFTKEDTKETKEHNHATY